MRSPLQDGAVEAQHDEVPSRLTKDETRFQWLAESSPVRVTPASSYTRTDSEQATGLGPPAIHNENIGTVNDTS